MRTSSVLALTCLLAVSCGRGEQTGSLEGAAAALGAADVTSLQFTASGRMFSVGQPPTADEGWPPVDVRTYRAAMNYESASMELELVRFMEGDMPRGGGAPFRGEQRQHQVVSGDHAWNVPQPPAGGAAGGAPPAQPQPAAVADRQMLLWSTPHGFVKAAAANDAATRTVEGQTEVSFNIDGRRLVGFINDENEIERVQTWSDNPVMGDMLVETTYTDYQDFDGVRFPSRIEQTQGGHPSLELTVSSVQANPTLDVSVPENVRNATPPAQQATSERLADGVYWITGGSHHSMAVDMGDHAVVIEAPLNEARSEAVIAETNRLIPDKPIRYVVNTHLHFDHSGGLRTFADEGATVVTHEANQSFFERAWAAPRAIAPDRLATSGRTPAFEGVRDTHVLQGAAGKRTIELHVVEGNPHNEQTLIAWLPVERILFQSDMMNPPAPNATVPPPTPAITNFYENVQRLGLQPRQIVGGHGGRVGTVDDLRQVAGQGTT